MPVDFRLKTPDTLGVLLGGGRQVQGSEKGVFAKFHAIFKGKAKSNRPKVVRNGLNKGEVMLKRTDGRNMRLQGLLKAHPGKAPKTDRANKLDVTTPKMPQPKEPTLHEQLDALTKAPRTESGQIEKTLGDIAKQIDKYKDTTDPGELQDLVDLKKLQVELKSAFLHAHVEQHTKILESVSSKTDHLSQLQDKEVEKRGGKSSATLSRLLTDKHEASSKIDKSLAEINQLIVKYKGTTDPGEQADVQKLLTLRRDLTTQAVLVEFPNLEGELQKPLDTKDAETAFKTKALYQHTNLKLRDKKEFNEVIRVAGALTSGKNQLVLFDDGKPADLHSLQTKLEAHIRKLESMPGPMTAASLDAREECVAALKQLSDGVGLRAGIEGTVDRLIIMQDPSGALPALVAKYGLDKGTPTAIETFTEMQKVLAAQKPPVPFRMGSVLRDLSTSLPHLHDSGTSPLLRKNREAMESLEVLTALVAEGEIPGLLLGRDPDLDKGLMVLQQGWGERTAVAHLTAMHARENKPVPTAQEIKDAREKGKAAATSRYNLTVANRRLAMLLKTDRRSLGKPSTWGDVGRIFGDGGDSSVRLDKTFIEALKTLGGKHAGRDVAFVIANISSLQTETIKAERELFGLHEDQLIRRLPPQEVERIKSGSAYKQVVKDNGEQAGKQMLADLALARLEPELDRLNPLAHIGISNKDIEAMGLSLDDQAHLIKQVATLHSQGLGNVDQVVETNEVVNTVIERVIRSSLTQENIVSLSQESATGLGRGLLHDFLIDAVVMEQRDSTGTDKTKAGKLLDHEFGISVGSESVGNAFKRMAKEAENIVTDGGSKPDGLTKLQTSSDVYTQLEKDTAGLMRERRDVDTMLSQAHSVLTQAQKAPPDGLGMDLDPHKPGGLRSAVLVQQALEYQNTIESLRGNKAKKTERDEAIAKRNEVLDQLKGFDVSRGRRPWHQKALDTFGFKTERPKIRDLKKLDDVTQAIIFVRQGGDLLKAKIDEDIESAGQKMDDIIQQRRNDQPDVMGFARQLVRTAVLANWPSGGKDFDMRVQEGRVTEGYDPVTKRTEIEKMLTDWGLDPKVYAPEIDEVLYGTLTVADLEAWRKEAIFSNEGRRLMSARAPSPMPWNHPVDFMTGRKGMDESTRRAFVSELESFQEGDKLNLKSGMRFTADTNRVSPTGGLGYVRARLAGSSLGQFLIERGSDGFKLHLRTGYDIKGNVDGGMYMGLGPESEDGAVVANASVDVSGGIEGSSTKLTGATFSFPPTPEGTRALIAFVDKMITEEQVSTKDWLGAKEVSQSSERTIKAGITGNAGIKGKLMFCKEVGIGISGALTGGIGGAWKKEQWTSHNEETFKGEVEIRAQAGVNVGLYAQLYKFKETGSDGAQVGGNVSPDLVGVGVGVEGAYTRKWKHVLNPDGQYTKGEIVRQSNVKSAKDLGLLSTTALDDKLEKDKTFKSNFEALMDVMTSEDVLAVTYVTKPEIIERVNMFLDKARQLYNEGRVNEANDLAGKAEALLDDDENYSVNKVSLITTTTRKSEVTNLNALFFKWENITDGKLEHPALVLSA